MSEQEELRALVREVIRDVLPYGLPVTETVNLSTDGDLEAFVKRLLDLDPDQREELLSGRKRFRLATARAPSARTPSLGPATGASASPVTATVTVTSTTDTHRRAELRVYLLVQNLQPQFAAYLGTPTRARGYPPFAGQHALIVEVAPALAIERVTDLALRAVPAVEPGILFVERQFGVLEVHGRDLDDVRRAGQAILDGLGADEKDQLRPRILFSDVIEDVTDAHAIIVNRNRSGSMIIPGDTLGVSEVTPALFAAAAANEAERASPGVTLVDVSIIGAAGRIYLSGPPADVRRAQREITEVLSAVAGRDHEG